MTRTSKTLAFPIAWAERVSFLLRDPARLQLDVHVSLSQFIPNLQTSGHEGVLKRAVSIQVRYDAAATVVIYSLEAVMSPPVQREAIRNSQY